MEILSYGNRVAFDGFLCNKPWVQESAIKTSEMFLLAEKTQNLVTWVVVGLKYVKNSTIYVKASRWFLDLSFIRALYWTHWVPCSSATPRPQAELNTTTACVETFRLCSLLYKWPMPQNSLFRPLKGVKYTSY